MTTVIGGQTLLISATQTSTGLTIQSGGVVDVLSGGTAIETTLSGGSEVVFQGGNASFTTIDAGGIESIFGTSIWDTIAGAGGQYIRSGGVASGAVVQSGGNQVVSGGGTATSTSVLSGGTETISAGGIASGSLIASGGVETVLSGGTASGSMLGGGASPGNVITPLHYAPNANEAFGDYNAPGDPGADGFNLADVGSVAQADALPTGVKGLIWLGDTSGLTTDFMATVNAAAGDPKVYGFYVADEPADSTIPNLALEDAYIAQHAPGKISFIVAENNGTPENPSYAITPANTGADLIGLDPYPVRPQFTGGMDLGVIDAAVQEATSVGWSLSQIVPVYQAFGGGDYSTYTLPTASQEQQILAEWGKLTPSPAFDYAYSWGTQVNDAALVDTPDLQTVFAQHNALVGAASVAAGGTEYVYGTENAALVGSGGIQKVEPGGTANQTTVGAGGTQTALSGGTTSGTVLSGGLATVASGGFASGTVISSGGSEIVYSGGTTVGTVILSGGGERVSSGGAARNTTVSSGGAETIYAGGSDSGALLRGGSQYVYSGATVSGVTIFASGYDTVWGNTHATVVSSGGRESVRSGGSADASVLSYGGVQVVTSGGYANATVVSSGGTDVVSSGGTDNGAAILGGGVQQVLGTATNSVVSSGGREVVFSGGAATATTISGGLVEVKSGAVETGALFTFASGGTLQLDDSVHFGGAIGGFTKPDRMDFRDIAFVSGVTTATFTAAGNLTSGTLTVTSGSQAANVTLVGSYTATHFHIGGDGHGGTLVTV